MGYYFISTSSKVKDSKLKGKQDASLDSRLDHLALLQYYHVIDHFYSRPKPKPRKAKEIIVEDSSDEEPDSSGDY